MDDIKKWWYNRILRIKRDPDVTAETIDNEIIINESSPLTSSSDSYENKRKLSLKDKIKTRFHYYIPIFSWLPKYNWKSQIVGDIVAGLGVGALIIPQSLAYASLAKLDPVYGLYTAWVCFNMTLLFKLFT